ncbi:MAG TPA: hypothetical protein VMW54_15235 [Terriglobia bacterium]|nr:hypothetical protein [Terriglobia bacterium]
MPTKSRRENKFIKRFLSAYENYSWAEAKIDWLDETTDGAIDALATRTSDGKTLAIEHTTIEPFKNEKEDFAFFKKAFLPLENDTALPVPGYWIQVFIPVGILRGQRRQGVRDATVRAIRGWLKEKRLSLPSGFSKHGLSIPISATNTLDATVHVRLVPLAGPGKLHIRRQQVANDLGEVIEKALKRKLPKLVQTPACKRVLLLERQHMNLYPQCMLEEVERRKSKFPRLSSVEEIWLVETMFYHTDSYLRFERYEGDRLVDSLNFLGDNFLR